MTTVASHIAMIAAATRANVRPKPAFSRCRSRCAASRTGPSRSSKCCVTRSNRAIARSTLSVTSVT
jgi:hypothetical protein